ncbi:hypothetical protein [Actinocorallia longicatena]|uniref:Uncharacterized protein n=1 Tax=Actinocorallia longicatena TaxID=111803 RepID=A0ABP6QCT3_9ACTN
MSSVMFATVAASDGISVRVLLLLLASLIGGAVGGLLGYVVSNGTRNQRLAACTIGGCVAFAGTYKFLDALVPAAGPGGFEAGGGGMGSKPL